MSSQRWMKGVKSSSYNNKGGRANANIHNLVYSGLNNGDCSVAFASTKYRFGLFAFFRFLPSVKSYYKALGAIGKLGDLTDKSKWTKGTSLQNRISYNNLTEQDKGFKEVVKLLVENNDLSGEIDELRFTRIFPDISWIPSGSVIPDKSMVTLVAIKDNREQKLITDFTDISDTHGEKAPIRGLEEMAEKAVRRAMANIAGILILAWLLITTVFIFWGQSIGNG